MTLLQNLSDLLRSGQFPEWGYWSYLALALLVAVEGPIVTLFGAAAASAGVMRPIPVFLAAAAGNLAADTLWYGLGYLGKIEWLYQFGHRLGINPERMKRLQKSMHEHAAKVLFFAKLSMSLVIPTLMAAGLVKAPWRKWFPSVFSAEMIWTGSLVLIGFYATEAIKQVQRGMEYLFLFASALFILFLIGMGRRILNQKDDPENNHT